MHLAWQKTRVQTSKRFKKVEEISNYMLKEGDHKLTRLSPEYTLEHTDAWSSCRDGELGIQRQHNKPGYPVPLNLPQIREDKLQLFDSTNWKMDGTA
jgi:hypothetical protein